MLHARLVRVAFVRDRCALEQHRGAGNAWNNALLLARVEQKRPWRALVRQTNVQRGVVDLMVRVQHQTAEVGQRAAAGGCGGRNVLPPEASREKKTR